MNNIALFGGSFDPPHLGHFQIVEALKNLDFIDKIVVMPTYLNPFKKKFAADAKQRLEWLQELFKESSKVEVNSFEVDKARKVPTVETVRHLKEFYDQIYLVIGADNLTSLKQWYKYEELSKLVKFIVVTREDISIPDNFIKLQVNVPISSSQLRKELNKEFLPPKIACELENYYKENNDK